MADITTGYGSKATKFKKLREVTVNITDNGS
jgi:hypothetical protein